MEKLKQVLRRAFREPRQMQMEDYIAKLKARRIDEDGRFVPDEVPMAPPIGYKRQPTMVEIVRNMVRDHRLQAELEAAGAETFEEADDFDIGDDPPDMRSGWENDFDPPVDELVKEGRKVVEERQRKAAEEAAQAPKASADPEKAGGA